MSETNNQLSLREELVCLLHDAAISGRGRLDSAGWLNGDFKDFIIRLDQILERGNLPADTNSPEVRRAREALKGEA